MQPISLHGISERLTRSSAAIQTFIDEGQLYSERPPALILKRLRDALSQVTGRRYVTLVNSGTQAMELMARVQIQRDRERNTIPIYYLPRVSHPSTTNAFKLLQVKHKTQYDSIDTMSYAPVLREPGYHNVFVSVGLFGNVPVRPSLITSEDTLLVDGCQSWVGDTFDDTMAISFDRTKVFTGLYGGGAIVTNDSDFHQRLQHYTKPVIGEEFSTRVRFDPLDAVVLLDQFSRWSETTIRRDAIANYYKDQLGEHLLWERTYGTTMQKAVVVGVKDVLDFPTKLIYGGVKHKGSDMIQIPSHEFLTDTQVEFITDSVKRSISHGRA